MTTETVSEVPAEVRGGVAPYIFPESAAKAADFYKKAFGATETSRIPSGASGKLIHCHLYINGGSVMLSDSFPEHGHPWIPPAGFNLHLQVSDIESWFKRAVDAGATVVLPVVKMFWGDLYGQLRDPFGVVWSLGETPKS